MEKIYNNLETVNNKRIIDIFVDSPKSWFSRVEMVDLLREFTGDSDTGSSLIELSKAGLLIERTLRDRRKQYRISTRSKVYKKIFSGYRSSDPHKFLKSNYTTYIIEKRGFETVYETIKPELKDTKFRKIASVLLDLPATRKEYQNFACELQETISEVRLEVTDAYSAKSIHYLNDELYEIGKELIPSEIGLIKILEDFEPVDAIRFYRENIHRSVIEGLERLAEKGIITEGLHQFLILDNYLSPLTSYPINGTLQLILSQPFQRIYEDIYLLDGESFDMMSTRAAAIYNYFPDILFELVKSDPPDREELGTIIMQMIFHWNVASTRFDIIYICLDELYEKRKHLCNYHLGIDGLTYSITDLDNNNQLLPNEKARSILVEGSIPMIFEEVSHNLYSSELMDDPFTRLRPCMTFKDMNWRSDLITIEEILTKLDSKLEEFGMDDKGVEH